MNRKGDLSVNIIIVAAIALLILVILSVLIFRNVGSPLSQGTRCDALGGGVCTPVGDYGGNCAPGFDKSSEFCPVTNGNEKQVCCRQI